MVAFPEYFTTERGGREERRVPDFIGLMLPLTKSLTVHLSLASPTECKIVRQGMDVIWQSSTRSDGMNDSRFMGLQCGLPHLSD